MTAPNPVRGEAALGEHKLVVDFNSLCSLEGAMGRSVPEILAAIKTGMSFSELRTCIRATVQTDMSVEEAGDLIGMVGYMDALTAFTSALDKFFLPKTEEEKARPRKAA